MTYEEIIQHVGRQIEKSVYYFDTNNNKIELNRNSIESAKPKFNCSLIGTVMKGLELELKEELPNTAIYFKNIAKYGSYTAEKLYAPYYFKEKPTYNADTKTYTHILYDEFIKTMVDYSPINISYPCTLFSYFSTLVSTLGYTTNIQSLPNGDKILSGDVFDGINYTYRDVFEDIGNATGTLFEIDGTIIKKCSLGTSNSMAIVDDDILKNANINFGEHFGPINTVVLSRSGDSDNVYIEDEELVARDGRKEFKIRDSQLMNDNNREEYLEELLETLKEIEYDIFDTELVGYGGFIPLQKVKFETGTNNYYSYVFNNEIEITQGYKETIYTDMPDETETNYKYADTTDKRINQAYILVDKQNQKITFLTNEVSEHEDKIGNVYTKQQTNELIQTSTTGITNTFSESGGNNIFRNTGLWFSVKEQSSNLFPSQDLYPSTTLYPNYGEYSYDKTIYEFWEGIVEKIKEEKASNLSAMLLMLGDVYQEQKVPNGNYTISFKYKKLISLANVSVKINGIEYALNETEDTEFVETIVVNSQYINILFSSDKPSSCEIYDLMVNAGNVKLAYSQNQNETTTDTVNISKGITIESSNTNTKFKADSDGVRIYDKNSSSNDPVTKFIDTGMETNEAVIKGKSQVVGTLWQEVGEQTWITRL